MNKCVNCSCLMSLAGMKGRQVTPSFDAVSTTRTALQAYRQTLYARYGALLKLRVYAVVSLGFERLFWQEVV